MEGVQQASVMAAAEGQGNPPLTPAASRSHTGHTGPAFRPESNPGVSEKASLPPKQISAQPP